MNWVLFKTKKPKNGQLVYTYNLDKDIFNIGYYEDNGEYVKTIDCTFYANSVRSLRKQLKDTYLKYD